MPPATPSPAPAPASPNEAERTVFAGEQSSPVEVTYRDGKVEKIVLLDLTYRQLHRWAALAQEDKQADLVELSAGRPVGWSDLLTLESAAALAEAALRVNFPKALRIAGKDTLLAARMQHVFGVMTEAIRLPGSIAALSAISPGPSPAESAAATGSAVSTLPLAGSPP
jgi:hypothetical protein